MSIKIVYLDPLNKNILSLAAKQLNSNTWVIPFDRYISDKSSNYRILKSIQNRRLMITVSIKDLNENKKNMTDNKFIRLIQRRNKKLDSN